MKVVIKMNEEKIKEELNKVYEGESWDYLTSYILNLQNKLENKQKIINEFSLVIKKWRESVDNTTESYIYGLGLLEMFEKILEDNK